MLVLIIRQVKPIANVLEDIREDNAEQEPIEPARDDLPRKQ
jgi:hypothetical protein